MAWTCTERGTGYTSGRLEPADRRPGGREEEIYPCSGRRLEVSCYWMDR